MSKELLATLLFWSAFTVSAGPFWTATMAAATTTTFRKLYTDYVLYLIFGWIPLIIIIGTIVSQVGALGENINAAMHFIGTFVILWMAWKIFNSKPGNLGSFDFNWKVMSLLSWTNPKVWLLAPIGFLSANITSSVSLNIILYALIGVPFFLVGVFIWGMMGRLGAKISLDYVNYFNALLMIMFASYLLYGGVSITINF